MKKPVGTKKKGQTRICTLADALTGEYEKNKIWVGLGVVYFDARVPSRKKDASWESYLNVKKNQGW